MKIAMIKIGSRISSTGTSAAGGQSLGIAHLLSKSGNQVDCYTKILKGQQTNPYKNVYIKDIFANYKDVYNNYDKLIIMSGNVNFYGGVENTLQILNYKIINNFKGQLYYFLVDVNLFLKQIYKNVINRSWGSKYTEKDLNIVRDDIVYISQPYDIDAVWDKINKIDIKIKNVIHFPLQKWILMRNRLQFNDNKTIDLIYGGANRPSRIKKILQFYFDQNDLHVQIFGNFKVDKNKTKNLKEPIFSKSVKFTQFMDKMSSANSTLILGDKWYQGKNITLRVYQSILANVVTFIDVQFDPQKRIYKNKYLQQFLYVKDKAELNQKIKYIKDNNLIKKICDLQYIDVNININEFSNKLLQLLKG